VLGEHVIADVPDHLVQAAQSLGDPLHSDPIGTVSSARQHQAGVEHAGNHGAQQLLDQGYLIFSPGPLPAARRRG